jgi:peptidoglycan/xylan/chitin deacetylase (PgdA/CDA1 family)
MIGTRGFLDAGGLRDLHDMGHVIGSHSASHPERMSSLPRELLLREWSDSVAVVSEALGSGVRVAAVPGGYYASDVAIAAEQEGIAVLFTSEPRRTPRFVGNCIVVGRLMIRAETSAQEAARAAAGDPRVWLGQSAAWNLRKPLKKIGGVHYVRLRRALLDRSERRAIARR